MLDCCSSHFRLISVLPTKELYWHTNCALRSTSTPPYLSSSQPSYNLWHLRVRCGLWTVFGYKFSTLVLSSALGRQAFSVAAPTVWNALPKLMRQSSSLPILKKHLKSLLFSTAFTWQYHSSASVSSRHYGAIQILLLLFFCIALGSKNPKG